MIAVMGAAGHVGGQVADMLLREDEEVRVHEHRRPLERLAERGAEVVRGDARDVGALRELFAGAHAALVLLPEDVTDPEFVASRSRITRAVGDALADCAVPHVVALSAVAAGRDGVAGPPAGLLEFERRLFECAPNVLVLRSALYMDYLLLSLPLIEAEGVNGSAIAGDLRLPMIATSDVAREAAGRLRRRDFSGRRVELLLGGEDVSMRQATREIGLRVGMPELPYVEFPPQAVEQGLVSAGMASNVARLLVQMQLAVNDGAFFGGIERTPDNTTPTRLAAFLDGALSVRSAS